MKILKCLGIWLTLICLHPETMMAQTISYPCSVVLHPVQGIQNAKGTALITKVKKPYGDTPASPVRERQSVGIYADWLPEPSSFGDYDRYVGFAQIPGVISWQFKMYQVKEDTPSWVGGSPWVGKFDEISSDLTDNTRVEVRLFQSKTQKLGRAVLQNNLSGCR
ncbi:hypothetical protein [Bacillus sp. NSP9.1]|uniref:hypothetical protein n=1 Tax=Bacillus sp. NSP9.1 TaxID=1071078 RepID=UPI000425EC89